MIFNFHGLGSLHSLSYSLAKHFSVHSIEGEGGGLNKEGWGQPPFDTLARTLMWLSSTLVLVKEGITMEEPTIVVYIESS